MKKFLIVCALASLLWADDKDTVVIHLTPYEEVLSGVMLLEDFAGITEEKRSELYSDLLEFSNITHDEFKAFLNESRTDPEKWHKIMERISSSNK